MKALSRLRRRLASAVRTSGRAAVMITDRSGPSGADAGRPTTVDPFGAARVPLSGRRADRPAEMLARAPKATVSARKAIGIPETSGQRSNVQVAELVRMAAGKHPNGTESDQLVGRRYLARQGRSGLRAGSNAGEMKDSRAVLERVQPRGNCDLAGERPQQEQNSSGHRESFRRGRWWWR